MQKKIVGFVNDVLFTLTYIQNNFSHAHFSGATQLEKSRSTTSRHHWIPTPAEYDTY